MSHANGLGLLAACARTTQEPGGTDGSTHWLSACTSDAECGELACVCGACTRRCDDAEACSGLGSGSACGSIDADRCPGEAPRACVAACTDDAHCMVQKSGTSCASGQCWPEPMETNDAGPNAAAERDGRGRGP